MPPRAKRRKRAAKIIVKRVTTKHAPALVVDPHALPSADNLDYLAAFRPEDVPVLSLLALCAVQSVKARAAEVVFDTILEPIPPSPSSQDPPPSQDAAPCTLSNIRDEKNPDDVTARYAEVRVLACLHHLRATLRDMQECQPEARHPLFASAAEQMADLANVLPDPLFVALTAVLRDLLASADEDALSKHRCHVLEVQLMHVVEATQVELLRCTRQLTVRAAELTLRFHHDIPLV